MNSLLPKLDHVHFPLRMALYHEHDIIDRVYFPIAGMISLITNLADGMQAEVGLIGREGMLGTSLLSGEKTSFVEAMVQLPGAALVMSESAFQQEIRTNPHFLGILMRYNEALHLQTVQTAACNGRHSLEERLARWLLMAHDRAGADAMSLTQEFMAMMLGVQRPSVSLTASILQRAGLIRYVNGHLTILDHAGLEAASCECYATVKNRVSRFLDNI